MRIFSLLPLLAIATLLSACGGPGGAQSVPSASQYAGAANASQSQATNAGAIKPSVNANYSCTASALGRSIWSAVVTGTTPGSVPHGGKVSMSGFQATVTIPGSIVNKLIGMGITAVTMEATVLDVNSTDAKPTTVNAAKKPFSFGPVTLQKNMGAVFFLPPTPITIGTWTALKAGTMVFTTGNVKLVLTSSKAPVKVTCSPKPSVTLSTTTVS
jgi:hypothetical protein